MSVNERYTKAGVEATVVGPKGSARVIPDKDRWGFTVWVVYHEQRHEAEGYYQAVEFAKKLVEST
jgi:hypothetical protein